MAAIVAGIAQNDLTALSGIEAVTRLCCCLLLQRCPANTYSPGGTQVACLSCPLNTVAPPGSSTLSACVPKPGFGLVNGVVLPVSRAAQLVAHLARAHPEQVKELCLHVLDVLQSMWYCRHVMAGVTSLLIH
jgi:hypothetical protein